MVPALALGPTTHIIEQASRLRRLAGLGATSIQILGTFELGAFIHRGSMTAVWTLEIYGLHHFSIFSTFTTSTILCRCAVE